MTSTTMLDKDAINTGLGRTTIVITTHYIEEARSAHRVGMMRFGKMLEEGTPDSLISRYHNYTHLPLYRLNLLLLVVNLI